MNDTPQKQCSKCEQFFPATSEFFPISKGKLVARCKLCGKAYSKRYHEAHKDEENEKGRQYYAANRDKVLERQRQYEEGNRDKILARRDRYKITRKEIERERHRLRRQDKEYQEYAQQYRESHKGNLNAYGREYRKVHSEQLNEKKKAYLRTEQGKLVARAHVNKRRARKEASEGRYTARQLQEQMRRQHHRCYYCQSKLNNKWHADHIVPLSRGGSNDIHN